MQLNHKSQLPIIQILNKKRTDRGLCPVSNFPVPVPVSNFEFSYSCSCLGFGYYNLEFVWNLRFVIWCFWSEIPNHNLQILNKSQLLIIQILNKKKLYRGLCYVSIFGFSYSRSCFGFRYCNLEFVWILRFVIWCFLV